MGNTHDTELARIEADLIESRWKGMDDYRWGYGKDRGPETWWIHHPNASSGNQSPVDIHTEDITTNQEFNQNPFLFNYSSSFLPSHLNKKSHSSVASSISLFSGSLKTTQAKQQQLQQQQPSSSSSHHVTEKKIIINKGTTICIQLIESNSYISGGPCEENCFILEKVQLHWGENDNSGSEHMINSRPFAAEIHLIHWNKDLFENYEEAVGKEKGILIIAIFAKLSDKKPNQMLEELSQNLNDILYRGQQVKVQDEINIKNIIPEDTSKYWTYKGSFTGPPCVEEVTWVILSTPVNITSKILNLYRSLRTYYENEIRPTDEFDGMMIKNNRPLQPLGTRKIFSPEVEIIKRRTKLYEGLVHDSSAVRVSIFPELFDPKRREELFKWVQ